MKNNFDYDLPLIFAMLNGRVTAAINKQFQRNCKDDQLDITPEQWTVLMYLGQHDGVTQQTLCNSTFKDKPSMTRLINNMERLNLVTRITSTDDKRINIILLTKKGREFEKKSKLIARRTLKEAMNGIEVEDLTTCQNVLKMVFKNMQD